MAGAHSVDVVGFQVFHVPQHLFPADGAAGAAAPLVAVDTFEHHTLAVQKHLAVLPFKLPQTDFHADTLHESPLIQQGNFRLVQVRLLSAPQGGISHRKGKGNVLHVLFHVRVSLALAEHHTAVVFRRRAHLSRLLLPIEHHRDGARAADLAVKGDCGTGEVRGELLLHKGIFQMQLRLCEQLHRAEQPAHAPEILILQPASGGKAVHLHGQGVLAGMDGGGHIKFGGGKGILGSRCKRRCTRRRRRCRHHSGAGSSSPSFPAG